MKLLLSWFWKPSCQFSPGDGTPWSLQPPYESLDQIPFSEKENVINNKGTLLTCSWHKKMKPQILQFTNLKCWIKAREPLKSLFNGVLFLIYYFKKTFKALLFHFKGFMRHFAALWICELENWLIRGFVFWCHEQVRNGNPIISLVSRRIYHRTIYCRRTIW